ncbi:fimbrial protein [Frateuria soli]|uniref:fimbrial protein n=1 Tax=Frateuria soli TaxID=1542730 RepID=UPI001E592B06|nr:fimbrial protein [Frateuria soli]UGB38295.1 type 1 fimbrial protein [Frateuria soli]
MRAIVVLLLLMIAPLAHGACSFDKINGNNNGNGNGNGNGGNRYTPGAVHFSVQSPIMLPFDFNYGQLLASPVTALPVNPPKISCDFAFYGLSNSVGGWPTDNPSYTYPVGSSGVGFRLMQADDPGNYVAPFGIVGNVNSKDFNVATTLQLAQVGTIENGYTIPANTVLASWWWGGIVPMSFILDNAVRFQAPACRVDLDSKAISVQLPRIASGAFSGKDTTAGATPFNIHLACPSGVSATLDIQFDAQTGTSPGYTTVLGNQGTATGVGVELVDVNGVPVPFGQATRVGAISRNMTLPYAAQYHATANTVTGGSVAAKATFTLSYE